LDGARIDFPGGRESSGASENVVWDTDEDWTTGDDNVSGMLSPKGNDAATDGVVEGSVVFGVKGFVGDSGSEFMA